MCEADSHRSLKSFSAYQIDRVFFRFRFSPHTWHTSLNDCCSQFFLKNSVISFQFSVTSLSLRRRFFACTIFATSRVEVASADDSLMLPNALRAVVRRGRSSAAIRNDNFLLLVQREIRDRPLRFPGECLRIMLANLFLRCECQRQTLLRRFSAVQRNRFQTAWLRHEKHYLLSPLVEKKLWTKESAQNPPEYDFQAMKSNDRQIHDAILSLEKHGLILLRNCGTEENFVLELANLMAAGPYPSVFG